MVTVDVLIPSYNCLAWIDRTLASVVAQRVQPRRVLVIDDASTEPRYAGHVAGRAASLGFQFLRNAENVKCPKNLFTGIRVLETPPDGVIFILDGDDFLPHPDCLGRIAEVYEDPSVWVTYGNYVSHPHNTGQIPASAFPPDVIAAREFRLRYEGRCSHPLTVRRHLWDHLTPADAQWDDGTWFTNRYDYVIMAPLLELAGDRFRFLDEVLYAYNAVNPISEVAIFPEDSVAVCVRIRPKKLCLP